MNTLYLTQDGKFNKRFDDLVNVELSNSDKRVLLLTFNNVYDYGTHVLNAKLSPQDDLLNDINRFVLTPSSFIMNLWDAIISEKQGQDVESLVLSVLGTFVNNIQEKRTLIVDEFNKYSGSVQDRILSIQKNGVRYGIDTKISTDHMNVDDRLLMQSDEIYIGKAKGYINSNVLTYLEYGSMEKIRSFDEDEFIKLLLERNGGWKNVIRFKWC